MSSFNREELIASCHNQPLVEAGLDFVNCKGKKNLFNVNVGQFVLWNPKTNKTLAAADIASASNVSIGVGVKDTSGRTVVRTLMGHGADLCNLHIKGSVTPPKCGLPNVQDFYFDCTECNKNYSIAVSLDDSWIRSSSNTNEVGRYVYSVNTTCCSCKDCTPEHNCSEVACALVDQINGETQSDPNKTSRLYKLDNLRDSRYQPFRAARLFPGDATNKTFCLSLEDSDCCEKCAQLTGITGVSVDGIVTEFQGTTKPGDTSVTLPEQIENVVEQMNDAIAEVGGSAILQRGFGQCCPYEIAVNTCAKEVLLITADGPVPPCKEADPFAEIEQSNLCKDCGETPAPVKPTCGIRIYTDPVIVPCHCDLPPNLPEPSSYVRNIKVEAIGEGWPCNSTYSKEIQKSENPEGYGYSYQHLDEYQSIGGPGRDYRPSNVGVGRFGLPDAASRSRQLTVKCNETYCAYQFVSDRREKLGHSGNNVVAYCDVHRVLIPQCDTITIAAWEEVFAELIKKGSCVADEIVCAGEAVEEEQVTLASKKKTTKKSTKKK